MATQINNVASATYGYGRDSRASAVSNIATTNLIEDYAISGTKTPLNEEFRPGENITYQIGCLINKTQDIFTGEIKTNIISKGIDSPNEEIKGYLSTRVDKDDLILTLGAGYITKLSDILVK